ncbi:hypothetical protein FSB78_01460 [Sphingomonas ginsenosidivorax]|uniref:Uncharacterized protein n=1 Tax=Sphingomonas ginsenosidivorax TaxID=862135 RepID=A0A5C6UCL6_9SPHN|nr:hypothetical protein [Sphingomonas ginsenosidivorax]TXC69775.1 hypothetical protein FSB78_01460 [Sphingomonas ginsenosidivorax]
MTDEQNQVACHEWQTALYEASYQYFVALKKLHETNPWPEHPVLANAINTLATELWDQCFRATNISAAFQSAVVGLPAYTAEDDIRP